MRQAISETSRRREKQIQFNELNGISPVTVQKEVKDIIDGVHRFSTGKRQKGKRVRESDPIEINFKDIDLGNASQVAKEITKLEKQMNRHAADLNFELAAEVRDRITALKEAAFVNTT